MIDKGYEPMFNTSSYPEPRRTYLSSGCGAILGYEGGTGNLQHIARAALMKCPVLFEVITLHTFVSLFPRLSVLYQTIKRNNR